MSPWIRAVTGIALAAWMFPALGQEQASAGEEGQQAPDPESVEQLIDTLEDPEARARLVEDLRLLIETQEDAAVTQPVGASDLLSWVVDGFRDAWRAIVTVDPREVVLAALATLAIVVGALLLRWLLLHGTRRLYRRITASTRPPDEDAGVAAAGPERAETVHEPPPTLTRLVNLVVAVLAVALIAETWGAGVGQLLTSDLGARVTESALAIVVILAATSVLWNVSGLMVKRLLTLGSRGLDHGRRARRLDALVPLLRSVLQVTIGVLSGLLILSEIGINIGPLLAGAGIVGLAVGFGAQTLVKDLITGVTLLLEDAATVGDVVDLSGHTGVVEAMRIRSIRLRDLSGNMHLIPYSEVTSIINMTMDFSCYLLDVGVAYREDTDEVYGIMGEVCEEMRGDEVFGTDIQEPLEILGVDRFEDSAVILRARIRTIPGRQWAVGREFNRRMKKAFDARGIEIPFPHRTLYFGEPKSGAAPAGRIELASQEDAR